MLLWDWLKGGFISLFIAFIPADEAPDLYYLDIAPNVVDYH
jgi:hypothetical protein